MMQPQDPFTPQRRRELTAVALRTFFGIARLWSLSPEEQTKILGLSDRRTLRRWQRGGMKMLPRDTMERISHVLTIFEYINILLPVPRRADAWLRSPNSAGLFGGRSPLERMTAGNVADLYVVRQYLEAEAGGAISERPGGGIGVAPGRSENDADPQS